MSPGGKETARRNLDDFTRRASQFDREVRAEEAALLAEAISGSGFGPGCVAVDMGAGAGASARPFLQAGGRVVGVDLTEAVTRKYGSGCPGCGRLSCVCPDTGKP